MLTFRKIMRPAAALAASAALLLSGVAGAAQAVGPAATGPTAVSVLSTLPVKGKAAATGEVIYLLAKELGVQFDLPMWEALYIAVATDTGCFKFSNTTPLAHRIAADAIEAVPHTLPALWRAEKLVKKAQKAGFDQPDPAALKEELACHVQALDGENAQQALGELLFAAVNLARQQQIDPEVALNEVTDRFISEFRKSER